MVTANNVCNRFKNENVMNDSYVERYIRAKKRNQVTPKKCLFGQPQDSETDEFLLQHDLKQMKNNEEVIEKYELIDETDRRIEFFTAENYCDEKSSANQPNTAEIVVKFQPKIITEDCSPPFENVFSPIEKIESTARTLATDRAKQAKITDYGQTSKRRRSSPSASSSSKCENDEEGGTREEENNEPEKEDDNTSKNNSK